MGCGIHGSPRTVALCPAWARLRPPLVGFLMTVPETSESPPIIHPKMHFLSPVDCLAQVFIPIATRVQTRARRGTQRIVVCVAKFPPHRLNLESIGVVGGLALGACIMDFALRGLKQS